MKGWWSNVEDFAVVFNVRRPAIEKEEAGDDCLQQQQPPRPFEKKEATTAALLDLGLGGVIGFFCAPLVSVTLHQSSTVMATSLLFGTA